MKPSTCCSWFFPCSWTKISYTNIFLKLKNGKKTAFRSQYLPSIVAASTSNALWWVKYASIWTEHQDATPRLPEGFPALNGLLVFHLMWLFKISLSLFMIQKKCLKNIGFWEGELSIQHGSSAARQSWAPAELCSSLAGQKPLAPVHSDNESQAIRAFLVLGPNVSGQSSKRFSSVLSPLQWSVLQQLKKKKKKVKECKQLYHFSVEKQEQCKDALESQAS